MAETSGFLTDLPQSAYLSLSMRRAISAAQQRSHRYVTLEHLLLALLDDPDALALLEAVRADIAAIRMNVADTVNRNLATLYTPGQFDLRASYKVERVLQTASDDAGRLGCRDVDGAFVLATLSREADNPAAEILKRNGFSYSAAMTWLYSNRGVSMVGRKLAERAEAAAATPAAKQAEPAEEAEEVAGLVVLTPEEDADDVVDLAVEDEDDVLELEILDHEAPAPKPLRQVLAERASERAVHTIQPAAPAPMTKPSVPAAPQGAAAESFKVDSWSSPNAPPISAPPPYLAPRRRETGNGSEHNILKPIPHRAEPQLPSSSRLDEMRLRSERSRAPLPAPVPGPPPPASDKRSKRQAKAAAAAQAKAAAAQAKAAAVQAKAAAAQAKAPDKQKTRARRRPIEVLIGRLVENIPRKMRAAVPERIEVRISREETQTIARGLEGRPETVRHSIVVTQTMSVALRAPDGGFTIEPVSPETQWIFDRPDSEDGDSYGRWRWVITPHERGQHRLQLVIAARSIDQNGLVGDTALPDQIITVRVRTNFVRSITSALQWVALMVIGGVLTELALVGMRFFVK